MGRAAECNWQSGELQSPAARGSVEGMDTATVCRDVLLVCRNGHVITDHLKTCPEQRLTHCDRCGATTLDRCQTCGQFLPGAAVLPGLLPIGEPPLPQFCATCGAAFPWTRRGPAPSPLSPMGQLTALLRRLPHVARQLRHRQGDRPPFRIEEDRDLEDLLRALLALHWDDVRPETRTPRYAARTQTDFLLPSAALALTAKRATPALPEAELRRQLEEDADYYRGRPNCQRLVVFVYDPEELLPRPEQLEQTCSADRDDFPVCCVIGR
jgi:hypothetical protein